MGWVCCVILALVAIWVGYLAWFYRGRMLRAQRRANRDLEGLRFWQRVAVERASQIAELEIELERRNDGPEMNRAELYNLQTEVLWLHGPWGVRND